MRAPDAVREWCSLLAGELECELLQVGLAPAPRPTHECHCIRVAMSRPPAWFRRLCARHQGAASYTRVRRAEIQRVLAALAEGRSTRSQWAAELIRIAEHRAASANLECAAR